MTRPYLIRESEAGDKEAFVTLYRAAFPKEDLVPFIQKLLDERSGVVSLVAVIDGELAGHVAFTMCGVDGGPGQPALLGPLCVSPDHQRTGIGSALVRRGFEVLRGQGINQIQVLGDPNYYQRFGFRSDDRLAPPFPLPEEWRDAWQSVRIGRQEPLSGTLVVPAPWQHRKLWGP
ncbi:MAG: N-acetyltransferase [Roseibium sp.]|nr:N-acetyltransferase [Roseibium sp.]